MRPTGSPLVKRKPSLYFVPSCPPREFNYSFKRDRGRSSIIIICPAVVRHGRCPARTERVLVVRVAAEAFVELAVLGHLVAVQFYPEAGTGRHFYLPALVFHQSALDDVVDEMMVMRVRRVAEVRDDRTEMQHRRELNSKLAGRMHGHAKLKRFAHPRGFYALANAAPECCVQ